MNIVKHDYPDMDFFDPEEVHADIRNWFYLQAIELLDTGDELDNDDDGSIYENLVEHTDYMSHESCYPIKKGTTISKIFDLGLVEHFVDTLNSKEHSILLSMATLINVELFLEQITYGNMTDFNRLEDNALHAAGATVLIYALVAQGAKNDVTDLVIPYDPDPTPDILRR